MTSIVPVVLSEGMALAGRDRWYKLPVGNPSRFPG